MSHVWTCFNGEGEEYFYSVIKFHIKKWIEEKEDENQESWREDTNKQILRFSNKLREQKISAVLTPLTANGIFFTTVTHMIASYAPYTTNPRLI